MNKTGKYTNGYLPKIAYHMWVGNTEKVMYFVNRQTEKYGVMEQDDWATVARIYNKMEEEQALEYESYSVHEEELNEFVAKRFPNVIGI